MLIVSDLLWSIYIKIVDDDEFAYIILKVFAII